MGPKQWATGIFWHTEDQRLQAGASLEAVRARHRSGGTGAGDSGAGPYLTIVSISSSRWFVLAHLDAT